MITGSDGGQYVNVNPGTKSGIDRAAVMNLAASNLADVYLSHFLPYSSKIFSSTHKARAFAMIRHPVKRAIDLFYYQQRAAWVGPELYDTTMAQMSLAEFAASDKVVENFMVRSLADIPGDDEVTVGHLALAKDVLRRKFMVGIIEWFDLSMVRYEKYFGWWDTKQVWGDRNVNHCHYDEILNGDHIGDHTRAESAPDTENPWIILSVRNWADIELYVYAKELFVEQGKLVE